ncbi:MAG: peptide deformylase [Candidatus Vogelbacteria bacterium RIFOXYD1_FULL_44_32]|uniref:Peptide deformylase n=1 Tax=Candidatus Vogelbacteria bacterium RIFOXYD1_FULL_44_32 TaxID=1802438 RepID=A0A1G2QCF3_9BACT|nr:MAG: peptide deformylase [Candidatus Vogelbacteria bacterium RIFOXYD1_FULL_44_32]
MKEIVQQPEKVLRQLSAPVSLEEIGRPALTRIIRDMSEALAACEDGVAIAAPQIGISLRIFVVSKRLFQAGEGDAIFINPIITKLSKKRVVMEEGCLSVRWTYGKTKRADKVTVQAYDELGNRFTWNASDLMAQIFQHEIDHLDGILFIDHATNLHEQKIVSDKHD